MKRCLALIVCGLAIACQSRSTHAEEELLKVEREFARAILNNDADAIGKFLTDDWAIVGENGSVMDKSHFLDAVKSGTLVHDEMELDDLAVRAHGDSAVVTTITSSKGRFAGQEFETRERATDFFVKHNGRWQCAFSQLTTFQKK